MKKTILILTLAIMLASFVYAADCVPEFDTIGIFPPKMQYGVGELINDVEIELSSSIGKINGVTITAMLLENNVEIPNTRPPQTFTDATGKVTIDFNYGHPKVGKIKIKVIAGSSGAYTETKEIEIMKTIDLDLNCPIQGNIFRDITCSWTIKDKSADTLMDIIPTIDITQGSVLPYTPVGKTGVTFQTSKIGIVAVRVSASYTGYISDTEQTTVNVGDLERDYTLTIDNNDIQEYADTGIAIGSRKLEFKVEESGQTIPLNSITSRILTPSGQSVNLVFVKLSEGYYRTNYDFQQPGQVYDLSGEIIFQDPLKPSILFSYKISTLKSDNPEPINYLIIGGSVLLLIIIIWIIVAVSKKGGAKPPSSKIP